MIKYKKRDIFRHIISEFPHDYIPVSIFTDFCKKNNYTFCVLKYNDTDGLKFTDGTNFCELDSLCMFISGKGEFVNFNSSDDNEQLYKTLNKFLNAIDEDMYDIVYVNTKKVVV